MRYTLAPRKKFLDVSQENPSHKRAVQKRTLTVYLGQVKTALFVALGALTIGFVLIWARAIGNWSSESRLGRRFGIIETLIGFVVNFFDTLGIGSFATSTACFKLCKLVPDELLPGTLNVGNTIPSVIQAFIYIQVVKVEMTTLVVMILASVLGAWLGAGVVTKLPRRKIQVGIGIALLIAAGVMLLTQFSLLPVGGTSISIRGWKLVVGAIGNALFAALMMIGIGFYAPCMMLVSFLGMDPRAAFPVMVGSCAFMMPVGSLPFIRTRKYDLKATLGITLGGIPAVFIAAFLVKSLSLSTIRWLVIVVVIYTATMMLRSARRQAVARRTEVEALVDSSQ